jgi:hypothetical protein
MLSGFVVRKSTPIGKIGKHSLNAAPDTISGKNSFPIRFQHLQQLQLLVKSKSLFECVGQKRIQTNKN